MTAASSPTAIDLFCGAGGLSYGMKQAGVEVVAGIDIDPACRHPFEANVEAKFYERDVADLSPGFVASLFPEDTIRVLAGCTPCQPFSSYASKGCVRDGEWQLLSKFGKVVERTLPEVVTMENVPRIEKHAVFDDFLSVLESKGYNVHYQVARCASYGVPQTRRRLVLLASRLGHIELTPPTHSRSEFITVGDSIRHMEEIGAGEAAASDPLHMSSILSKKNLERIRNSKAGGTWRDWSEGLVAECHVKETGQTYPSVYGRMRWDHLAPTITTQFIGFGNGRFGHPVQDRAISLREGALLQTFPEDYSFVSEDKAVHITQVARLIGNAVPVRLGEVIGRSIVTHLENHDGF